MRLHLTMLGVLLGGLILPAGAALAAQRSATTRPTHAVDPPNCVTADCHARIKSFPALHGPVAADTCDACHLVSSVAAHTFEIRAEGEALCTYCHEFSVAGLPVVHQPVATGECLGCHDPHGGTTRAFVREDSIRLLCNRCHEDVARHVSFEHFPVAKGECDSCHPPHAAQFPGLLDLVGTDLCLACHADFEQRMAAAPVRHEALQQGCDKCHHPHGEAHPNALRQAGKALCLSCHEDVKLRVATAMFPHSVVDTERACLHCHTPHFSAVAALQPKPTVEACLSCHNEPIQTETGTVAAVPETADPALVRHGPIREGSCGGCHDAHGGDRAGLLRKGLSRPFYQRFSVRNYELCFGCHDQRLVSDETAGNITGFRDGERNLHFLHANRDDRDRGCRVCHLTHAAGNERLIRPSVQYGRWLMPMQFQKSQTGGSCFPGCHPRAGYDREHPVGPTTAPSLRQSPLIARVQRQDGRFIHWSPLDRAGQTLTIPDPSRPTVLLFLGESSDELPPLVRQLSAATGPAAETQVIVVACGPDADELAEQLVQAGVEWPIVADPAGGAVEALEVCGWPVVLVLRRDGMELVRLSGEANALALKLPAYLELASGRIDAAQLERRVAGPEVEEDPISRTRRTARTVRAMLRDGRAAEALRLLDELPPEQTGTAELVSARVELLLRLDRAAEAIALLDGLPPGGVPPAQEALLRAEAAVMQQRWQEARQLLEPAVARWPTDARLHYLLGQVCEQAQDWSGAAVHYRAASEYGQRDR